VKVVYFFTLANVVYLGWKFALIEQQGGTIDELNLQNNNITSDSLPLLTACLREHSSSLQLRTLRLFGNQIDSIGAIVIANDLLLCSSASSSSPSTPLQTLILGDITEGNPIGNEGLKSIAAALHHNSSLTSLDIGNCEIGDEGLIHLAECLTVNTTLQTIAMHSNRFTSV
jgi:Ran GTPase-activating protein (RanGAP) involved in mRNA processing and transport